MTQQSGSTQSPNVRSIGALALRIKAEFEDLPGLCLTLPQARRLWELDDMQCEAVLAALIDAGVIRKTGGCYLRAI